MSQGAVIDAEIVLSFKIYNLMQNIEYKKHKAIDLIISIIHIYTLEYSSSSS